MADSIRFAALKDDLAGELKRLQGEVRARPDDAKLRTYLFQQGFRDGYQGLLISSMAAWYVFLKWAKTLESFQPSVVSYQPKPQAGSAPPGNTEVSAGPKKADS